MDSNQPLWERPFKGATFKPYSSNLLTPGANLWIFAVRISVIIMAVAEATSWGYLGFLFGGERLGYITALCLGVAIFIIVWIIAVSLVTMDTGRFYYASKIGVGESNKLKSRISFGGGIVFRVFLVAMSLIIIAPFLSQIVFHKDISAQIEQTNNRTKANERIRIEERHDKRITEIRNELESARQELVAEISGTGGSGRYGDGEAAKAIRDRISGLENLLNTYEGEKADELRIFDNASIGELEEKYKLSFQRDGVTARGEALKALVDNPGYVKTEIAVKGFLVLLFVSMLVLKVFQPESIRFYYSEQIQGQYNKYCRGAYNDYLPDVDKYRKGESGMSPMEFVNWITNEYPKKREREITEEAALAEIHQEKIKLMRDRDIDDVSYRVISTLLNNLNSELVDLRQKLQATSKRVDEIEEIKDNHG